MNSIKTKISTMAIGITVAITVVLLTVFFLSFRTMVNEQLTLLDTTLRESFDRTIRWEVESAVTMLDRIANLEQEGLLDRSSPAYPCVFASGVIRRARGWAKQ